MAPAAAPAAPVVWEQIAKLRQICTLEQGLLAHLYWPQRLSYLEQSSSAYLQGNPWRLKATANHGVHSPARPTLNFFVVDEAWVDRYATAAETRGLRHGLLLRGSAIEALARRPGYEFVEVKVGYPRKFGIYDPAEFWRCDLGNHRFKALDVMRFSTVVRFATPEEESARYIDVPNDAVVTWW